MKTIISIILDSLKNWASRKPANHWQKLAGGVVIGLLAFSAQAQTTIKPTQSMVEVPVGFSGTLVLSNNTVKVTTNGAAILSDGTGTNWNIPSLTFALAGAPAGVTASVVDSLGNPVTTVPVSLNTGSTSKSTNIWVKLVFDGTEVSGVSALNLSVGGGITSTVFNYLLEVGKIWNGSGNAAVNGAGNFGDSAKWLGGLPGANDDVVFTDVGCQTNSLVSTLTSTNFLTNCVVNTSMAIASLRFCATNNATNCDNIFINPGVTLAIKGNNGFSMLRDYPYFNSSKLNVAFSGTGGTLVQTNNNANFSLLIDGQIASVLDMSGLGNLYLDVNSLAIGDIQKYPNFYNYVTNGFASGSTLFTSLPQKILPTWKLALTNFVRATYVDPYNYTNALVRNYALVLGRNQFSGGSSGTDFSMNLGYSNAFYLDGICIAAYASLGSSITFLTNNSYALFRNTNGGRMSVFATADAAATPYLTNGIPIMLGDNTKCAAAGVDFSKGTVDMLVDRLYLSMDGSNVVVSGKGVSQTAFIVSSGTVDANTAILGYQSQGTQTNQSYCYAIMNISNTALFRVNGNLALGYSTCAAGSLNGEQNGYGQILVGPGGTVLASNITVGGVTKVSANNKIALQGNATLVVSNRIADASPNGALGTLSFSGGNNAIKLFIDGANSSALINVTNFTQTGTGNKLIIGSVKNLTFPADVVIMQGAGSATVSSASFDGGVTMPTGSGLSGTLTTDAGNNRILLHIINRTPNNLVWRGVSYGGGTADWDYTTKNWLDRNTGLMTNYDNPDIVAFDDTPGFATNINLAGSTALTPTVINLTNNSLSYLFLNSPNQIIGGPAFNKYGSNSLEIDGNVGVTLNLNQGRLVGANSSTIANANVAAGAILNFAGSLVGSLQSAGVATSSGTISGTLTALSGGIVTNTGTVNSSISVQSGGYLYNYGTLNNIGVGSAGSPQVANGGTFVNDGTIGGNLVGSVLYVNGTFEDIGDAADNMTVQSVTIGVGATFLPGANALGITTINSDGTGTFPGSALLVQGSTNVFKIDVTAMTNSVLRVNSLSYGGSASARSQAGATLQIINTSSNAFSAGQSFHLFDNVNSFGTVPYNTGSSTNTYPVIIPTTPGPGLTWDLSQLWVSGNLGITGAGTGPMLTNSIATDGTGTNIVSQFSWDASKLGYRLQTLVTPVTSGLAATNWTGISGSWTNTAITITNVIGTNCVFYRLAFP